MLNSKFRATNTIALPYVNEEISMIPFDLETLVGLPPKFLDTVSKMIEGLSLKGTAFFTIHGKSLKSGVTLRRPAPHTDGNYEPHQMSFGGGGGNGWKVGENGPAIDTDLHARQYLSRKGGMIIATNYASCLAWRGEFEGNPAVGGDCRHIDLGTPELLKEDTVYYANNHFIHESIPVGKDVHRVFARITLPEDHEYN